ncbi:MAG: hypothetical protein M1548_06835 [Actinobacteria bacterium]|nr:hypothetical protein [Chloroflexota bacterium]MCL5292226.1 hypothetical protein [Actinomycetota bacterium]
MGAKIDLVEYRAEIDSKSRDDLDAELERLEGELDDLEMERHLIIGQSGVHINAVKIQAFRETFDRDEARLQAKIALVKDALRGDE